MGRKSMAQESAVPGPTVFYHYFRRHKNKNFTVNI